MNTTETPRQADDLSRDDSAQSRTDRLIASADARLESAGQSIENNRARLKQSRAFLSSDDTARAHGTINQVFTALVKEMADAGDNPTAEQLESWRDRLSAAAETTRSEQVTTDG